MKKIKIFFLVIISILCISVLYACNKDNIIDLSELRKKRVEIKIWIDDEKGEYVKELIEEFNKTNPDIAVAHQHVPTTEAREQVKLIGFTDQCPDIINFPHDHLGLAVEEELLYEISNDLEQSISKTLSDVGLGVAKFKGAKDSNKRLYAIPTSLETLILYYNKELIGEKTIESFEEAVELAKKWNSEQAKDIPSTNNELYRRYISLSTTWDDPYYLQFINSAFGYLPFGKDMNDNTQVGFETQEAIKAFNFIRNNVYEHIINKQQSSSDKVNFEQGKTPYIIGGPWDLETFLSKDSLKDKIGITTLPKVNGNDASPFAGAQLVGIYKQARHKPEAEKFIEFLASKEAAKILYQKKNKVPALKDEIIDSIPEFKESDLIKTVNKQIATAKFMPAIPEIQYYWGPAAALYKKLLQSTCDINQIAKDAEDSYKSKMK